MQPIVRNIASLDWVTVLLVICLGLYAVAKYLYPKRFQEYLLLPATNKYFLVLGKNEEIQHPFNMLLFVAQLISMSLFIYLFISAYTPKSIEENEWIFVQVLTGYAAFILVKYFVEKIIGTLFSMDAIINQYLYQKLSYRNLIGILVFIFNLLFFFIIPPTDTILLVSVAVLIAINGIALFYSYKTNGKLILSNFFYFIVYLCALEISPYIIMYKVFLK